jgi:lipopolysaccharide/colanic/teichoic acid biosynthesis glycosyltransferase
VSVRRRAALGAKRGLDIVGAATGLVLLSPILAWTAVAALATQGRPVFFRHQRPGLHGRPFTMVKFRTMRTPRRGEVWYDSDAQRVTRVGSILRSTSIDELPELWNVLRGDMSLVGPRPLLVEYLDRYTSEERRRHEMKPGITGWAAVNGRHAVPFEDRLALDVWYVDHWSLWLDLRILFTTVGQVLRRADVATTQDLAEIEFPARFRTGLAEGVAARDAVAAQGNGAAQGHVAAPGGREASDAVAGSDAGHHPPG